MSSYILIMLVVTRLCLSKSRGLYIKKGLILLYVNYKTVYKSKIIGIGFQFCKIKNSGDCLHNTVNVFNTPELYP